MLEKFQMIHGLKVHFVCFSKSDTRVKNNTFIFDACLARDVYAFLRFGKHVGEKIVVFCVGLVVHQTAGYIVFGYYTCHFRIIFQSPYIIDKISACLYGNVSNTSFICIYRNRNIKMFAKRLNDRNDTGRLFFGAYRSMSRPGGFSADIQNISTLGNHCLSMLQSMIHRVPFTAIRERIRCDIQDSHNIGSVFYVKFTISNFHFKDSPFNIESSYFFSQEPSNILFRQNIKNNCGIFCLLHK